MYDVTNQLRFIILYIIEDIRTTVYTFEIVLNCFNPYTEKILLMLYGYFIDTSARFCVVK